MPEPYESDNPFTPEQVQAYNRWSHFEADINKEFNQDVHQVENNALGELDEYGITENPEELITAFRYYRKAVYNYFLDDSRARGIAPPVSVVGPANYSGNVGRADKIRENASASLDLARKYIDRAVGHAIKGKTKLSTINEWLPLAQSAGNAVKFGKLYLEAMKEKARQMPEEQRGSLEHDLVSGNGMWESVYRSRGRALYKMLIPEENDDKEEVR
jgi:hypothetical protein